jgi:N-acetylmuramoyl-L-alanine amidase
LNRSLALSVTLAFIGLSSLLSSSWAKITPLIEVPEWRLLEPFQESVSIPEFKDRINKIYSRDGKFYEYFVIDEKNLTGTLYSDKAHSVVLWTYRFADKDQKFFEKSFPLPKFNPSEEKPLEGLTIALDPGHIGGEWAKLEERFFKIKDNPPIMEAELNILTCRHLAKKLEEAGATVVWTKNDYEPVTSLRPIDLEPEAMMFMSHASPKFATYPKAKLKKAVKYYSELLFYRTSEISARAHKINDELKPDLTLCVHFNAAPWGSASNPKLVNINRLVLFTHGAYEDDELEFDDQKYRLLWKLFENSSSFEIKMSQLIGDSMKKNWSEIPSENYGFSNSMFRVSDSNYVYARNLAANRMFNGPVIFIEGPYMNDKDTYQRLIAGDYEGTQNINGKEVRSIFREFGEIIAEGVKNYSLSNGK